MYNNRHRNFINSRVVRIFNASGNEFPKRATKGDSGIDISVWEETGKIEIGAHQTVPLRTGLYVALPAGCEGQIRPRSSISLKGLLVHLGTIDNGYRGEIIVIVTNLNETPIVVESGMRIAQLVVSAVMEVDTIGVESVESLGATERGSRGLGSTGK